MNLLPLPIEVHLNQDAEVRVKDLKKLHKQVKKWIEQVNKI